MLRNDHIPLFYVRFKECISLRLYQENAGFGLISFKSPKEEYQHFGERKQLLCQHKRSEALPSCFCQLTKHFCESWTLLWLHSTTISFTKQSCSLIPPIFQFLSTNPGNVFFFTTETLKKWVFRVFLVLVVSQTCFVTSFVEENWKITTENCEFEILHFTIFKRPSDNI